jgi:phosphoribosylanthranilate isomerase
MIRVKICGITNLGDALHAIEAGADALGFILWSGSKRAVAPQTAREIIAALPPFITTVGVFVNETARSIERLRTEIGFTVAQLSGDESPEILSELRRPVVKAFRTIPEPAMLGRWKGVAALLADGAAAGQFGGTGTAASDGRLILAGGLTPETVAERAQAIQPYAVDVAGGVEASPGVKDSAKVTAFISAIRGLA